MKLVPKINLIDSSINSRKTGELRTVLICSIPKVDIKSPNDDTPIKRTQLLNDSKSFRNRNCENIQFGVWSEFKDQLKIQQEKGCFGRSAISLEVNVNFIPFFALSSHDYQMRNQLAAFNLVFFRNQSNTFTSSIGDCGYETSSEKRINKKTTFVSLTLIRFAHSCFLLFILFSELVSYPQSPQLLSFRLILLM